MKTILKYSLLAVLGLAMLSGCKKSELDTDQFNGFAVAAIAPNPVMRGGELRIVGGGLENAKEVKFAGGITVTDISVVAKGARSEIRVMVPVEGPEVGKVSVVGNDGRIASTKFDLTYTEPISIESFAVDSDMPDCAFSGDVLVFRGDYLNNVKTVIFSGEVPVIEFVSQSRHELKVYVPCNALTGPVILSDVDELNDENTIPNHIYTATDLLMGFPVAEGFSKRTIKAGEVVTINGKNMDMVKTVSLPNAEDIEFEVTEDRSKLTFVLPAKAQSGTLKLYTFDGDILEVGQVETVVVKDLAVKSLAEDERFKAGTLVEISGNDLDLVTKVEFEGAEASWYLSEGKIIATQPDAAKDGPVTVTLESGAQAFSEDVEVVKPVITAWQDVESVVAGESEFEMIGTDLDLVTSAVMGTKDEGLFDCEFVFGVEESGATVVKVSIPREAFTAPVILTSAAGYSTQTPAITVTYNEAVSIKFDEPQFGLGNNIRISGKNLLKIEQVYIKGKKVVDYAQHTDDAMSFAIPDKVGPGIYRLDLVLVDGTELTWPVPFEVTAPFTEKFIWEGYEDLGEWNNQPYLGAEGAFTDAGIVEGDVVRVYFTPLADDWQFQAYGGHWDEMHLDELGGGKDITSEFCDASVGYFAFNVTAQVLAQLTSVQGWGGSWTCNGKHVALTGLSLIHFGASEKRTPIWEGSQTVGNWDGSMGALSWGGYDWSTVEAGTKLAVSFTATSDDAVMRFGNGSWASMPSLAGLAQDGNIPIAGLTSYEFELTDADLAELVNNGGLVICGAYWILTEVALVTTEGAGPTETVIWEGSETLVDWVNQPYLGAEGAMAEAGMQVGDKVRIYFTTSTDEWVFQIYGGHWESLSFAEIGGGNELKAATFDPSAGYFEFTVTEDLYGPLTSVQGWGGSMVVQGNGVTITSVAIQ